MEIKTEIECSIAGFSYSGDGPMATVNGTTGSDFIHVAGDGRVPPGGYNEIATSTNDVDAARSERIACLDIVGRGRDLI